MFIQFLKDLFFVKARGLIIIDRKKLQALMLDCQQTMEVTFKKKSGEIRTITGRVEYVKGHNDFNRAAHMGKYVTLTYTLNTLPQWRNVSLETVTDVKIGRNHYVVTGNLF